MNCRIRIAMYFLLSCGLPNSFGFAESGFRFVTAKISSESRARYLGQYFVDSEKDLAVGEFDPRAERLLRAAETYTQATFNLPSLKFIGATTHKQDGDVLVVRWTIDEPFAKGDVFLQDSPNSSRYEFRLTNCAIQSKEDVEAFFSKLVVWRKPPNNIMPGALQVTLPTDNQPVKAFSGAIFTSSASWLRNMTIDAARRESEWLATPLVCDALVVCIVFVYLVLTGSLGVRRRCAINRSWPVRSHIARTSGGR